MATLIGNGVMSYAHQMSAPPDENFKQYIHHQHQNFINSVVDTTVVKMVEGARRVWAAVMDSDAARLATAAARGIGKLFATDEIQILTNIADFQHAPPVMQPYLMAHPIACDMYANGMCDGYSGTWEDHQPGARGDERFEYRQVTNGMLMEVATGDETEYVMNEYTEKDLLENPIDPIDAQIICASWANFEQFWNSGGEDPTSVWNAKLA